MSTVTTELKNTICYFIIDNYIYISNGLGIIDNFCNVDASIDIFTTTDVETFANLIATDTTLRVIMLQQIYFENNNAVKLIFEAINKNHSITKLTIDNVLILFNTNNSMLNILSSNKFLDVLEMHIHDDDENNKLVDYLTINTTLKSICINYESEQDLGICYKKNECLCNLFDALCTNTTITSLQICFKNCRNYFENEELES